MRRNYNDEAYTEFRKLVLKRDKRTCQMPDCGSKKSLHVHHIKTWARAASLRYDVENGITLCRYCHKSITGLEIHYEPLFMEINHAKKSK